MIIIKRGKYVASFIDLIIPELYRKVLVNLPEDTLLETSSEMEDYQIHIRCLTFYMILSTGYI